jgi:hypothetical protein
LLQESNGYVMLGTSSTLDRNAPWGLKRMAKDPATFIHFMRKALFSAAADREYRNQTISRFGHQIKGFADTKNQKDIATKVLVDQHGYRHPMYQRQPDLN